VIDNSLKNHQKVADEFRLTYNSFTYEASKLAELECNNVFDNCMEIMLETKGNIDEDD
jgi:hypothetical protein